MRSPVRVAVTGLGVKSPAGNSIEEFWRTLCAGQSVARHATKCFLGRRYARLKDMACVLCASAGAEPSHG